MDHPWLGSGLRGLRDGGAKQRRSQLEGRTRDGAKVKTGPGGCGYVEGGIPSPSPSPLRDGFHPHAGAHRCM